MRKIKETLRLRFENNQSIHNIAASVGVGSSTIGDLLIRFRASGFTWPLAEDITDEMLEARLYRLKGRQGGANERPLPDFPRMHQELRRKGVTKQLLWLEYKANCTNGYEYTQFCNLYKAWTKTVNLVFRSVHIAGEKMFVDYAGQTVQIHDAATGEVRNAQIFIAVLGASSYTFAEATWTQSIPDWLGSHCRALEFFGGVPQVFVPDNLKAGISKPHRYDPVINPAYYSLAKHYHAAVVPARVKRPRDKAKAEVAVQVVERWILAVFRHRKFFSLDEVNEAISERLDPLNNKPFKKMEGSRMSLFLSLDKPALQALPEKRYEIAEFKLAKVNINYHVEVDRHHYSVPYQLVQKNVEVRYTDHTVEVFYQNNRISSHHRSYKRGGYSTNESHMPIAHKEQVRWTPERLIQWAGQNGSATEKVARGILNSYQVQQQGFASVLGIIRLADRFGHERLENACVRAVELKSLNYQTIKKILINKMDQAPLPSQITVVNPIQHTNIRGAEYYSTQLGEDYAHKSHH